MAAIIRLFFLALMALVVSCAPARQPHPPGTIPEPKPLTPSEEQYGHQILSGLTQRWELDYNHPKYNNVTEVVEKLTKAARADKDPWHVYVLKDDSVKNAAATRGNHVFIWTGMLNATQNDAELAAILAHEIAHVLARHTDPDPNEELKRMLIEIGSVAAGMAVVYTTRNPYWSRTAGDLTSSVTKGLGSGLLVSPYTREKEKEADQIGFFLMADAGYAPQAAIDFWSRALHDPDFQTSLAFLSDHPPAEERLSQLKTLLPRAQARFQGKPDPGPTPQSAETKKVFSAKLTTAAQNRDQLSRPRTPELEAEDSFDMSRQQSTTIAASENPSREVDKRKLWRVRANKAPLHSRPEASSRIVGDFKKGAEILETSSSANWIEIHFPDHGYLQKKLLEPLARHSSAHVSQPIP